MAGLHPLYALYPGVPAPTARVDAHALRDDDAEVLKIHLTRYELAVPVGFEEPEGMRLHVMAMDDRRWGVYAPSRDGVDLAEQEYPIHVQLRACRSAGVVVSDAGDEPPRLVLDDVMTTYMPRVAGVVIDRHTVLVGIRTFWYPDDDGYIVTMAASSADDPGPIELYPSALYAWAHWWTATARDISPDQPRYLEHLPPPPLELDVIEGWTPHRVQLLGPERTRWPTPPVPRWSPDHPDYLDPDDP